MRTGILSTLCTLLAGASGALGQLPPAAPPEQAGVLPGSSIAPSVPPVDPYIPAPPLLAPPGPPYMPYPPAAPPEGPSGPLKWLRTNAFGPRFTPFSARNAFGPHQTLPEELQDNIFCSTPPCDQCPDSRIWFAAEYLFLVLRNEPLPGPTTVYTPSPIMGFVPPFDPASTQIVMDTLAGDGTFHNGGRFTAGMWLTRKRVFGVEGNFFVMDQQGDGLGTGGDTQGNPLITGPNYNALLGNPGTFLLVSDPRGLSGRVSEAYTTEFWGAEGNILFNPIGKGYGSTFLGGYRYLQLNDTFSYSQSTKVLADDVAFFRGAAVPANSQLLIDDQFETKNQFHGGHFGVRVQTNIERLFFSVDAKLGLGQNRQTVDIRGATTFLPLASPILNPAGAAVGEAAVGGLMATRSNIGRFTNTEFSVVPEIGVTLGCHITHNIHVFGGYNFLYWSKVLRPAGVINTAPDPSQVPTSVLFQPPGGLELDTRFMRQTDFWAQGVNFGLVIDF
jgi:hypothetical protein